HAALRNSSEVTQLVNDARAGKFNAIVVEVRKRGDAYYVSNFEPKATDVSPQSFDPLADLVAKAHDTANGQRIEVHAWIVSYPIWNNQNTPPPQAGHPYNLHPDWVTQNNVGTRWDGSNYNFDPGHPAVQEHTFNVAMDLISRYDIDGLNFDYIRYGGVTWGYNPVAVARFNQRFGRTGSPAPTDPDWMQWRRDQVTGLVRKVYLSSAAIKPQLKISADTICFAPGVTSAQGWTNSAAAYISVLQDWRSWMEEGIIDINMPMAYFDQAGAHLQSWLDWNTFAKNHRYNRHVVIGGGFYQNSLSNVLRQIRHTRVATATGNIADGVCGFSYAVPTKDGVPRATFLAALTQPGTSTLYETNATPVFASIATVPAMPWKTAPTLGHLKGFLRSGADNSGLEGVTVEITGPVNRVLKSDATGFYGAVDLAPGSYSLLVMEPGFEPAMDSFNITAGAVATRDLTLPVVPPGSQPAIVSQPAGQSAPAGATVEFRVLASGSSELAYQWHFEGSPIDGATGSKLTLATIDFSQGGFYSVTVTNDFGSVTSDSALLTVQVPGGIYATRAAAGYGSAIINWQSPEPADSRVEYGVTTSYGNSSALSGLLTTNHAVRLSGLLPDTTYYFRVRSAGATEVYSAEGFSFRTAGSIIVDNPAAAFGGSWSTGTSAVDKFGSDYRFSGTVTGAATATATWRPAISVPGRYAVSTWYPQGANRSAAAPFTIFFDGGSQPSLVNQTANGGGWRELAADLPFAAGLEGRVQLANNSGESGKVVLADGIRFSYLPQQDEPAQDALPGWWMQHYFSGTADPAGDTDGDGLLAWQEYLLGTNPTDATSVLRASIFPGSPGRLRVTFSPWQADRSYQLESRGDFGTGSWVVETGANFLFTAEGQAAFEVDWSGGDQLFFRVNAR
ncbi:MAG TPA: hypothetical protein DCY13_12865, partial [Verrucomicrobiales bacterium]|nr:hypothetical protein [Verrucomicrobiales bacterium]